MLAEEVRHYKNRCDVPDNDISLVNAADMEVYLVKLALMHETEIKELRSKIRSLESDLALIEKRGKRW
jgi:hypothetical protein